jgi:hypothetical protein
MGQQDRNQDAAGGDGGRIAEVEDRGDRGAGDAVHLPQCIRVTSRVCSPPG